MTREKSHDEIYCRSCGEPIKKKAEICPECGVPNEFQRSDAGQGTGSRSGNRASGGGGSQSTGGGTRSNAGGPPSGTAGGPHDPSQYTTTVSENWHYGVAASVAFWVVGFALPEGSATAGFLFLSAWVLMPVSVYYDRQWLRATTKWNPNLALWVVLSLIPLVNIVAGAAYLLRRNDADRVSPPGRATEGSGDDALDRLRDRYSRGELTDAEFEAKVEQLVGTEDRDVAELTVEDRRS